MIIELAIPQTINRTLYTQIEIKKPHGNVLANTEEIIQSKNVWYGILEFVKGCTVQLLNESGDINNQISDTVIKSLYWNNIKTILIKIMAMVNKDAYAKGRYECPMCGSGVIVKQENDNSVKYIDLPILKGEDKTFSFELIEPVKIKEKDTENIILKADSLSFRMATLGDLFIVASKNLGQKQSRQEYAALAQTITALDGNPVDAKTINTWGLYIIEHLSYDDLEQISIIKDNGGIQNKIPLYCKNCGETFDAEIDTDSFFFYGLAKRS